MGSSVAPARQQAWKVLSEIDRGAYTHVALALRQRQASLSSRDWALVTELVYGVVRQQKRLDWVLVQYAGRSPQRMETGILRVLRLALYQLMYLDIPPRAVVHQAGEQARVAGSSGATSFVNGVLRNYLRQGRAVAWPDPEHEPVAYLAVFYSHPEWLVRRWYRRWGFQDTARMLQANNTSRALGGRFNTLLGPPESLARRLRAEGLAVQAGRFFPEAFSLLPGQQGTSLFKLDSFREGLWTVQDEGSLVPGWVLRPCPGESILDACAGPGGKTGHLAQLMANRGKIMAWDIHRHRLQMVEKNCRRLGIGNVKTSLQDARYFPESQTVFDRVLVDAPCSGTGVLARRPDARWRRHQDDPSRFHRLQLEILRSLAAAVKPGGILVYATCSLETEENQETVRAFLAQNSDFRLDGASCYLPAALTPAVNEPGWVEVLPHRWNTDGMFVARMCRSSGS